MRPSLIIMKYLKVFHLHYSQRIFIITSIGLVLLEVTVVLLIAILEHLVQRLEEPLEERKKLVVEESLAVTPGSSI